MSKHIAKIIHLVLEIVSTEPIRAIQHKLFGDYSRGSNQVVRRRHECSVGTSAGGNVIFAPVSWRAVPFGLLLSDQSPPTVTGPSSAEATEWVSPSVT